MIIMAAVTSFGHIHLWTILVYCLNTVSCQTEVRFHIGDDALLPCVYTSPLPPEVTISWRDKDDSTVLDIKKNIPNLESQSTKFKGRVKSFPDLYMKGNFSIHLQHVQQADAGVYECHIRVPDGPQQRIRLTVLGKRAETTTTTPPRLANDASAGTSTSVQLLLLLASPLACLFWSV